MKKPAVYEALRREGASKSKAAAIANAQATNAQANKQRTKKSIRSSKRKG